MEGSRDRWEWRSQHNGASLRRGTGVGVGQHVYRVSHSTHLRVQDHINALAVMQWV